MKKMLQNNFIDMNTEEDEDEVSVDIDSIRVQGIENITKCIIVDQKPIGRKSTSTPISYLGGLTRIR
jgi:excinuclease UvrABC ATPase subunit